jgi:hypothetical protein
MESGVFIEITEHLNAIALRLHAAHQLSLQISQSVTDVPF